MFPHLWRPRYRLGCPSCRFWCPNTTCSRTFFRFGCPNPQFEYPNLPFGLLNYFGTQILDLGNKIQYLAAKSMILRQIIFDNHTFLYALCRHSSMSENKYVIGIRSNAYTPMCFLISVKNSYTFRYALTQPSQQNANTGTDGGSRGSLAVAQILALRQYGSHTAGRGRGGSNPAS